MVKKLALFFVLFGFGAGSVACGDDEASVAVACESVVELCGTDSNSCRIGLLGGAQEDIDCLAAATTCGEAEACEVDFGQVPVQ